MIIFSEGCSTSILMPIISNILYSKFPYIFIWRDFFPPSSVSNLVSKVSDMDKLVSCLPVDSGALGLKGLDMRTLQMSSQLRILEDPLSLLSQQLHPQDYLNFFSHCIVIICSHHVNRHIRLPWSQSNTVLFAHPALLLHFYAVFFQVVSVLPLALLPSGTYPSAVK